MIYLRRIDPVLEMLEAAIGSLAVHIAECLKVSAHDPAGSVVPRREIGVLVKILMNKNIHALGRLVGRESPALDWPVFVKIVRR